MNTTYETDVIIIGCGLAGLVTALELIDQKKRVIILERDEPQNAGGLAKVSFGGILMVNTPLQKRGRIHDHIDLALADWFRVAQFQNQDVWPKKWAEAYVHLSCEYMYHWLVNRSVQFLPVVNWPERGLFQAHNSVPRWHIVWGTGHRLIELILKQISQHPNRSYLSIHYGHKVTQFTVTNGIVNGCCGVLEKNTAISFSATAGVVVVASGGYCGGDLTKVKTNWYKDWGNPPDNLLNGSHRFADGLLHDQVMDIGGNLTHMDKQWHYAAGIHHPKPEFVNQGLSLVPPRSALWVNALGERIGPVPLVAYTDTRYLVEQICKQPGKYSWQVMNWKIAIRELAVSGCDYMTAFRYRKPFRMLWELLFGNRELVSRLMKESKDIIIAHDVDTLVSRMNQGEPELKVDSIVLKKEIKDYDDRIKRGSAYMNDYQLLRIADFRKYRGDRLRVCSFQPIDDPKARPLIAIRECILSRKSLGGIQTDLSCRVLDRKGKVISGLFAVGEAAGFGGGGIHGVGSLEGTFLGSCILTGRLAAKAISKG
ncbi:MAG: FAD-binding protein [Desulfobacterales bacterium]|nr:FAD-binding protein [Desulfobacterales bacterium]